MLQGELYTELKDVFPESQMEVKENEGHPLGNGGKVAVYPKTENEISHILQYANKNGKTVSIVGGGTKRGFGGLIDSADILLSLANLKGIVEHTVGDMTLTVKAGTPFQELQQYLEEHNQKISLDPAWPDYATIGGIIAVNESGPKRLAYGSARDAVIGLRVVYPNGKVIRTGGKVVKNVAGYDMNKLFVGSMGTLGVLTEITLKLRPLPKYESNVLLSFTEGDFAEMRSFAAAFLDSQMEPVSLELISPSLAEKLTGEKFYTLAISFEDNESSVHYQESFLKSIQPPKTKMTILAQEKARKFWQSFYTISPNGRVSNQTGETEAVLKIGVVNLDVLKVIRESHLLQDTHNLLIEAHGGLGHGLCQIILRGGSENVISAIQHLRNFVKELNGYVVIKHLPFILRQKIEVWGENPPYFFLFKGIKTKIDPNNILNPKRFVGGI